MRCHTMISGKLVVGLAAMLSLSACGATGHMTGERSLAAKAAPTPHEAKEIATQAYIYGYPLVTMEMTRRVSTNVVAPEGDKAPMGQFANLRTYPNASFRTVTAPNADTLYSSAWLDLGEGPYVLHLPDEHGRYYLMPMLSGWTDVFAVPGKRTTGTGAGDFAITGPTWKGTLPEGLTELKSPTDLVWILGRTYSTGTAADYATVHKIQDRYRLVPLSSWGKPFTPQAGKVDPSIDMKTAVRDQVDAMDGNAFFSLLAELMKDNPPADADASIVAKMARIGVVPGQSFDAGALHPDVAAAVAQAPEAGQKRIMAQLKSVGRSVNGWTILTKTGVYGTDYTTRALVTTIGLGANRPQDAVYPTSEAGADGRPYDGTKSYVMHFERGMTPPVNGFWSLTMYDGQFFFVANPLNRYTLSPRNPLKYNDDGSLDLYLQHESPGKAKESNWLPAPAGRFILMLRMYWPKEAKPSILDGTWNPPAVRSAS